MTDMAERVVGLGLIGCGARLTGVIERVIEKTSGLRVVALCDPSEIAIAQCRERLDCPDAALHEDHRALSADPSVDWVCVGSWNCFHKEHILGAFAAGKHVFTEKPLVTTMEDAVELKAAVEGTDRLFSMGFVLRYAPFYQRIKALLDEGVIGQMVSFEFNETLDFNHGGYIMSDWRRQRANAGTHLLEKCSHDVDLMNWLTESVPVRVASFGGLSFFTPENAHQIERIGTDGEGREAYKSWQSMGIYTRVQKLNPFTAEKDIIDNQVGILEYANGTRATFHTDLNTAMPERRVYICGTEGTLRGDVLTGQLEWRRIGFDTELHKEETVGGGHGGADGILADSLRESMLNGTAPLVGLEDGMKASVACFGLDAALDSGTVVDLRPMWAQVNVTP
ncbi:MAG: Gfo/Idh/MocA family oxidoreductase [Lentisphaerae bacterium]|nr:Gfo/Idh/MocA family oxidoreductase [Lentisphaerota bacterium]